MFYVLTWVIFYMTNHNCRKFKQNQIIFYICAWVVEDSRPFDFGEDRLRGKGLSLIHICGKLREIELRILLFWHKLCVNALPEISKFVTQFSRRNKSYLLHCKERFKTNLSIRVCLPVTHMVFLLPVSYTHLDVYKRQHTLRCTRVA